MSQSLLWGTTEIVNYLHEKIKVEDGSIYILGCWDLVLYNELVSLAKKYGLSCEIVLKSSDSSNLVKLSEKNGWKQMLEVRINEKLNINVIFTHRRAVFFSGKIMKSACALVTEEGQIIDNLKEHFIDLQKKSFKLSI